MTKRQRRRIVFDALWPYVGLTLLLLLLWDGGSYLLDPPAVPAASVGPSNDPWLVLREVPGGLRTHGVILLGLAVAMVFVLSAREVTAAVRSVLALVAFYTAWSTIAMAGAWFSMPDPIWTSPSKWAVLALLTVGLIRFPRTSGKEARA